MKITKGLSPLNAGASVLALAALLPASVSAQTATTAPSPPQATSQASTLGEVVVTARRRAEDISKVPVSITAFSSEAIEQKNITNVASLTKLTPGLNITGGGSRTNVFVTIRGQTRGVTGNVSPGVLTYFNEVPLPTYGSLIQTYDMDNIQVLKGPQGTLFGRNSIGGAVLTYSKAPTYDFSGYVKGEIGQYKNRTIEGAINIPIIQDAVALRLAGQRSDIGGYTKSYVYAPYTVTGLTANPPTLAPSKHDHDEFRTTSFRGSLRIEPVDWIKNITVVDYTKTRGLNASGFDTFYPNGVNGAAPALYLLPPATLTFLGGSGALGPTSPLPIGQSIAGNLIRLAQCGTSIACDYRLFQQAADNDGRRVAYGNSDPWASVTKIWGVSNTTTININDAATLKNIFGYRTNDSFTNLDVDGTPMSIVDTQNHIRLKSVTEELQLSGSLLDDKLKYTVGGFYYKQSPDGLGGSAALEINAFFGLAHSTSISYFTDKSKALYGQVDYSLDDLLDGLSVTAGYRQTWDTSGGCVMSQNYSPFAVALVMETPSDPIPSEATCRAGTLRAGVNNTAISVSSAVLPPVDFKKGTYNLGVNWQVRPQTLVYAATRRGYRAGSYNSPLYDAFVGNVQTFAPETLTDVEVGAKHRWGGAMPGAFDLAVFRGKDKGTQLPIPTSSLTPGPTLACIPQAANFPGSTAPPCTVGGVAGRQVPIPNPTTYTNAGKATISGFEAQTSINPIEGLTLGAGASYVHVKTDSISLDPNFLTVLIANRRTNLIPTKIVLRQQPKWTFTANAFYQYPDEVWGGKLSFNVDLRYRDEFHEGEDTIGSATTVDARLALDDIGGSGVDTALTVSNLFDAKYDYGSVGSAHSSGYRTSLFGAPRTFAVSVRYAWGG